VAKEGKIMLGAPSPAVFSDVDRQVFAALVPADHFLRRVDQAIDFQAFRGLLECCYSPDHGRPADEPVRLLKLCYLQFQYRLSDREVLTRTGTDIAFRLFLGLGLKDALPDPSLLCVFRGRLGVDRFEAVFNALIAQARQRGLVRDRLRLKDASHVLTSVAIPNTLSLVAQTRNKLLEALRPFDATRVAGEEARLVALRLADEGLSPEQRLEVRVAHLVDILAWADDVMQNW
jgi:transposase